MFHISQESSRILQNRPESLGNLSAAARPIWYKLTGFLTTSSRQMQTSSRPSGFFQFETLQDPLRFPRFQDSQGFCQTVEDSCRTLANTPRNPTKKIPQTRAILQRQDLSGSYPMRSPNAINNNKNQYNNQIKEEWGKGSIYGVFAGQESVAHPPARRPVTANVRKSFLVVAIRRAEWHFLDRLIHDQSLKKLFKKLFKKLRYSNFKQHLSIHYYYYY